MKILVAHNGKMYDSQPIETYARSMVRVLRERGHEVIESPKSPPIARAVYKEVDFLLDIDCGRDDKGQLRWHGEQSKPDCPSAVYLIDSHGYPEMHQKLARKYDHVFFAVWDKRDLFASHKSAHWCPNFTDAKWFDRELFEGSRLHYDFGFFGSKGGLDRANPMKEVAERYGWKVRIDQIRRPEKHRWPHTGQAMYECNYLFNHGQKHDGPNLRVMESMLVGRTLINNSDNRDGMSKLFEPYVHYVPFGEFKDGVYNCDNLKDAMLFCRNNPVSAKLIANHAYNEVKAKHLVGNRIDQILEAVNAQRN